MRSGSWNRSGSRVRRWAGLAGLLVLLALAALVSDRLDRRGGHEGQPRLIDGDSLVLAGREMRLEGIDAPEGRQTCMRNGASWPCGEAARRHLQGLIGTRPVRCSGSRTDQHDRVLASCEAGGRNLNAAMVEDGFAVAFGTRYQAEEARARAARRGLWSGEFERPRDWRERHPR